MNSKDRPYLCMIYVPISDTTVEIGTAIEPKMSIGRYRVFADGNDESE